jgi:hypothetical protein
MDGDPSEWIRASGGLWRQSPPLPAGLSAPPVPASEFFNSILDLLWKGNGQTGHYPYPSNIGGDGSDVIAIGYSSWDHNGHQLWSHDRDLLDHADGIMVGNLSDDPKAEPLVYASASDEGFVMFDLHGHILKHLRAGHMQSPSVGKYRMNVPGLQYVTGPAPPGGRG